MDILPAASGRYALGTDLGATAAFSACAAYWPDTGRLEGFVSCGTVPELEKRERRDGVVGVYSAMRRRGELVQLGGRVVPVGPLLKEAVRRWGRPSALAADRYRQGELSDGVAAARLSLPEPTWRGQGFRDGSVDVRAFRAALLDGEVFAPVSLAMRAAFREARGISDAAGNTKLAKHTEGGRRSLGRDDLVAAIILAVAEGRRRSAAAGPRRGIVYRGMVKSA